MLLVDSELFGLEKVTFNNSCVGKLQKTCRNHHALISCQNAFMVLNVTKKCSTSWELQKQHTTRSTKRSSFSQVAVHVCMHDVHCFYLNLVASLSADRCRTYSFNCQIILMIMMPLHKYPQIYLDYMQIYDLFYTRTRSLN